MANQRLKRNQFDGRKVATSVRRQRAFSDRSFDSAQKAARDYNRRGESGKNLFGSRVTRGEKNAYKTMARFFNQYQRTNNTYYEPVSKEQFATRHRKRGADLRAAFGMSAG